MSSSEEKENVWWLCSGLKTRDRPGKGTFAAPDITSFHKFGWNKEQKCFILQDEFGLGSGGVRTFPVLPTLAEKFLVRCLDPEFHRNFLSALLPQTEVRERFVEGKTILEVCRGAVPQGEIIAPGLSLRALDGEEGENPSRYLFLFGDLRLSFGQRMLVFSAASVRQGVYG